MRIIEINWDNNNDKFAINIDKIISIDLESFSKKINICTQDGHFYHIPNKDKDELKKIYENILDFCMFNSNPDEIGYIPSLKIDIK